MSEFVVCINHDGNPGSLVVDKIHSTLSDTEARAQGLLCVLDEDRAI